jgi:RNA polymerase sigma-70 factor, ECF subfamily
VTESQAPEPNPTPEVKTGLNPMATHRRPGTDSAPQTSLHKDSTQPDSAQTDPANAINGRDDLGHNSGVVNGARQVEPAANLTNAKLTNTEQLLDEHFELVFRYAYRLSGNATAAEDVAQEVFLRAFRNLHQLRDAGAAKGWLLVITRNEFNRWCTKYAPQPSLEAHEAPEESAEPESAVIDREEWVQQSLDQLPLDYRTVVVMFYFEQLSYTEIAEQLEIPLGTVMSRLNRGKAHLKKTLTNLAEPKNG